MSNLVSTIDIRPHTTHRELIRASVARATLPWILSLRVLNFAGLIFIIDKRAI